MTTRRTLLAGVAAATLSSCATTGSRLQSRPTGAEVAAFVPGRRSLGIRKRRDAQLYLPESAGRPEVPLLVYLHGAGGSEEQGIKRLQESADALGFALLSPASEDRTWDAIRGSFGADVKALDEALRRTFGVCWVDAKRIGLCGFSDGASYALGLGLANGDLFQSVMAFSPGFIPEGFKALGTPRVFVSHGTRDEILPIETCSRRLVPELKRGGYQVTYREFDGPHGVPREVLEEAGRWFLG